MTLPYCIISYLWKMICRQKYLKFRLIFKFICIQISYCDCITTGSDILALDVKDVKDKTFIELREQKTNKYKQFPINERIQADIKDFIQDKGIEEPLFLSQKDNRLSRVQAYKILRKAAREVGIEVHIGTHSLRKTFGYHHYKQFNNIALLQRIFNHSTPAVTLRYIGLFQEEINDSYKKFFL